MARARHPGIEPAERSKAAADYGRSQFERLLAALEARLEGREFLLGAFSLVDVAAASWLVFGAMFGIALDAYPRVLGWYRRCSERLAFKRAR